MSLDHLPLIDTHMHLVGSGCYESGCWLHPKLKTRYTVRLLRWFHGVSEHQLNNELEMLWGRRVSELVGTSAVDYGVVLGLDGVVNTSGQIEKNSSQMIIPHQWVFEVCKTFPNLLPGPSINPHRVNALQHLAECIEQKAVLIKWLPSVQLIDPLASELSGFYSMLAQANIPLLIHCGDERTFHSNDPKLNEVQRLKQPLEAGVKVICAHTATKVLGTSEPDQLPLLRRFLGMYPNLWVDNSGLCNPSRYMHVPVLAKDQLITSRTLYGSDYPVPVNAFYFLPRMGLRKVAVLERFKNVIDRDIEIKRYFGYPEETLTRANDVLANLDYWIK